MTYLYRYTDKRGGLVDIDHPTISRPDNPPLTEYKGRPVRLVIGASAAHFKGTGFYQTDYKRK